MRERVFKALFSSSTAFSLVAVIAALYHTGAQFVRDERIALDALVPYAALFLMFFMRMPVLLAVADRSPANTRTLLWSTAACVGWGLVLVGQAFLYIRRRRRDAASDAGGDRRSDPAPPVVG